MGGPAYVSYLSLLKRVLISSSSMEATAAKAGMYGRCHVRDCLDTEGKVHQFYLCQAHAKGWGPQVRSYFSLDRQPCLMRARTHEGNGTPCENPDRRKDRGWFQSDKPPDYGAPCGTFLCRRHGLNDAIACHDGAQHRE